MNNIEWKLSVEQKLYIEYHLKPPFQPPVDWYMGSEQYKKVQQWLFQSWMEDNKPSQNRKLNEGIWHQMRREAVNFPISKEEWKKTKNL